MHTRTVALLLMVAVPGLGQDQKLPVPDPAEQKKAEAEIRSVFKEDFAKKTREGKRVLAARLLTEAADSKNTPASRYVVLQLSRDLAIEAMDVGTIMGSIDQLGKLYDVAKPPLTGATFSSNTNALKVSALNGAQKYAISPEDSSQLGDAYLKVAEDTLKDKVFDDALSAAQAAEKYAKQAKATPVVERAGQMVKEIPELKKEDDLFGKAISSKADDAPAKLVKGRYTLFVVGDESAGIENLLGCSDEGLKAVAKLEAAKPATPEVMSDLAEAWITLASKEEVLLHKRRYQSRARHWFDEALKIAGGIARAKIEKRLGELEGAGSAKAGSPAKDRLILDLGGGVRMDLVYIKPGAFTMGSPEAPQQGWQVDERPEHRVTITKGYFLGKYDVTRGQFAAFVKATGYKTVAEKEGKASDTSMKEVAGASWQNPKSFTQTDEHPVVCITWNDAKAFADWASKKTGREVRLPTEAEWEYACRAGTKTRWWFGDNDTAMADFGWLNANSGTQTHPVGQKKPNPWGLYDMHGNVWEWCQDWSGPYAAGDAVDPAGPADGTIRCLRGGCWNTGAIECRSAIRGGSAPSSTRTTFIGFRVAVR